MKINLKQKFVFSKYKCDAYLINFKNFNINSDKVFLHEEIIEKIESLDGKIKVENFEPIIVMTSIDEKLYKHKDDYEINRFYLLDGHHRWDYAKNSGQINKLKCILVNYKDVRIKPYKFEINTKTKTFESLLIKNGFQKVNNFKNSLRFNNQFYASNLYNNKMLLYKFKSEIQKSNIIIPIGDKRISTEKIVSFTPIVLEEILNLNYLLPPKSTWITPRI